MTKTVQVYDPAMCCSSGVCGTTVDPLLARFAADLEWLKAQGVNVERYNLAQQPGAFVANAVVKRALDDGGPESLPFVLVDGALSSRGTVPDRAKLAALASIPYSPPVQPTGRRLGVMVKADEASSSGCCGAGE